VFFKTVFWFQKLASTAFGHAKPMVSVVLEEPKVVVSVENRWFLVGYKKLVAIAKEGVWENKNLFYPHRL
jgi:hypothetical protein